MKYFFDLEGEDHTQFVWECEADNKHRAMDKLDLVYPEAKILNMQSEEEYNEVELHRYDRLVYEMENDCDLSGDMW